MLASTWPAYTARNVGQAATRPSSTLPARVSSQGGAVTGASGPGPPERSAPCGRSAPRPPPPRPGGQPEHRPQRAGQFPGQREQRQREGQPRGAEQGGRLRRGRLGRLRRPRRAVAAAPGRRCRAGGGGALGARRHRPGQQDRRRDPAVRASGEGRPASAGARALTASAASTAGQAAQPPPVGPGQHEGRPQPRRAQATSRGQGRQSSRRPRQWLSSAIQVSSGTLRNAAASSTVPARARGPHHTGREVRQHPPHQQRGGARGDHRHDRDQAERPGVKASRSRP